MMVDREVKALGTGVTVTSSSSAPVPVGPPPELPMPNGKILTSRLRTLGRKNHERSNYYTNKRTGPQTAPSGASTPKYQVLGKPRIKHKKLRRLLYSRSGAEKGEREWPRQRVSKIPLQAAYAEDTRYEAQA